MAEKDSMAKGLIGQWLSQQQADYVKDLKMSDEYLKVSMEKNEHLSLEPCLYLMDHIVNMCKGFKTISEHKLELNTDMNQL